MSKIIESGILDKSKQSKTTMGQVYSIIKKANEMFDAGYVYDKDVAEEYK